MQQSILFKVQGKPSTSPIETTNSHAIGTGRTMPARIARALFSPAVSAAVAIICVYAMWWHNITVADTLAAQQAVGLDCLCAMPWALAWAFRAATMPMPEDEKGGEL